jgi:hypothetical protein
MPSQTVTSHILSLEKRIAELELARVKDVMCMAEWIRGIWNRLDKLESSHISTDSIPVESHITDRHAALWK